MANSFDGAQVATVGRISAEPGAPNVIPGKVITSLEIRDLSSDVIEKVFNSIQKRAAEISAGIRRRNYHLAVGHHSRPCHYEF